MGMDRGAAFLILASASGVLIFMLVASSESLFTAKDSITSRISSGTAANDNVYNMPADVINVNGSAFPFYSSDTNEDPLFYENRISDSQYAHLEDTRQFGAGK